jgi:Protein of unknown function (DUF3108)
MARWLIRLPLALLLALAVHAIMLWVIAQEMQALASVIKPKADPLFTRQITQPITQAAPSALAPIPDIVKKKPAKPTERAQAAIKSAAKKPTELPLPEPIPDLPTVTVTATVTEAVTQSIANLTTSTVLEPSPSLVAEPSPTLAAVTETLPAIVTETTTLASVPGSGTSGLTTDTLVMQGNWPIDTRLTYHLGGYYRGELHGDATVQWTRDSATQGEGYQVRIDLSVGPIKALLTSQGKVSAQGLLPQAYEEQWAGRQRSVTLDASDVVLTNGKRIPRPQQDGDAPALPASVQDTASQFVELGHRFAHGRAKLAEGAIVHVWLARPGGLDAWVYDVGPAETLYLPHIGPVQAYHLTPRPQASPRGSMVAEMWFAPSLQYLPVRIKLTLDKDAHLDLKVQKIEQR